MSLIGMSDYTAKYRKIAKQELTYIVNRDNLLEVDKEYYELLEHIKEFREFPLLPDARYVFNEVNKQTAFYKSCLEKVEERWNKSSGFQKEAWNNIRGIISERLGILENIELTVH